MTEMRDEAAWRAAHAYDAASDTYDEPALSFWNRFGLRTVERLALASGGRVLDVCCGSGASALPAAEAVGPTGSVTGVDLSEALLVRARAKAAARGLAHATFRAADFRDADGGGPYDAVICVFGIFFVPDMAPALAGLWKRVRPGGVLAVTTWGPRLFEPGNTAFWNAVRNERSDLVRGFNPWDRIVSPEALQALFAQAGIPGVEIEAESARHRLERPEDWWSIVRGTGYRATIETLGRDAAERVRTANLAALEGVKEIESNVIYAVARKPAATGS